MANRGLGTLTLDLVVKTGGFTGPLDKAGRDLDKKTRAMQKRISDFGRQIGTALKVGLGIGVAALGIYIKNTIEAEKVQAQLTSRIKDTAGAAGRSLQELNAQADKLQSLTVFDDESIGQAQAALLTFTQIQGLNFDRTIEAATDLATVMGTDVAGAAKILGKALSDPLAGIGALRKAGITLTEDQKALVKQFQETGDIAAAQGVILDALAGKMGTAAEAARNTLGGALQGLQNAFNNLLEGDGSSAGVRDATAAINGFSASLNSPEARQNVDALINALVSVTRFVGDVVSAFVKAAQQIGNTMGLIGQYSAALSDVTKATLSGDFAAATAAQKRFIENYKQFVEETKRTRGDFDAVVSGTSSGATVGRRTGANSSVNRIRVVADNATAMTSANTSAVAANTSAKQSAVAVTNELSESNERLAKQLAEENAFLDARNKAEQDRLDIQNNARESVAGLLSDMEFELDLMGKTNAERIAAIELRRIGIGLSVEEAQAAKVSIESAVLQLEAQHRLVDSMDEFRASFEDSVVDVVTGAKSIGDALKSLADTVVAQIARMIAQQLSASLFGAPGSTGTGSSGGLLSSLFSTFLPKFATGTDSAPGGFAIVGERGPEIVNLPRGSSVTPNTKMGQSNVFNISIANGTPQVAQQVANEVSRKLAFSTRGGR